MAQTFDAISSKHRQFIEKQHLFFVASAAAGSRVNLSPKGLDGLRVLDERRVAYLDLTGSGNETSAHLRADGRLTIMFCAFEDAPLILRLYGTGRVLLKGGPEYAELLVGHFDGQEPPGARQIVVQTVDMVQTSCGFGVPLYAYEGERPSLIQWAEFKGEDGLDDYRREKNAHSIDGLPTGMFED